jgi:type II secretory pathway component PulC|tara:strand:- start:327 stop:491 length:165 start_codon:yes stop_codon:yes gene_type:complete
MKILGKGDTIAIDGSKFLITKILNDKVVVESDGVESSFTLNEVEAMFYPAKNNK